MYTISNLELPSLILYGDEAEESMTTYYMDFTDALKAYNTSFLPLSLEEQKSIMTEIGELQTFQEEVKNLKEELKNTNDQVVKQGISERISTIEINIVQILSKVKDVESLMDKTQKFTLEQRANIKTAENNLKAITLELLENIAIALKQEDKVTPAVALSELKALPKGLKHQLILDIAREPLNSFATSFLVSLEQALQQ